MPHSPLPSRLRDRSRSPGRPYPPRREPDRYNGGGGGGRDRSPPGGGRFDPRRGDDWRGGPSSRGGDGGGGYRGDLSGGGGYRADRGRPDHGYDGRGRRADSRDRGYQPSSYRRSPSPGFRRRSPSPSRPLGGGGRRESVPKPLSSMFDLPAKRPVPAPSASSRGRSTSPVKHAAGHAAEAEEGEVEEGEVASEPSKGGPTAAPGGSIARGGARRSPSTSFRRSFDRRSPSPPGRGGFRDGTARDHRRPSPAPSSRSRRSGRSPSPAPRRRSPSPVGGGGGWRRPRDPSPPRNRYTNANAPRRLSPPRGGGGGGRYRSPSPRGDHSQRRRFRSPTPPALRDGPPRRDDPSLPSSAALTDEKSVRPGPPRAGAWRQKALPVDERAASARPEFGQTSAPLRGRDAPYGGPGQQSSPWGQRSSPREAEHGRAEALAADRRREEEAERPVGGDEWAARMKARQEEKERLRRAEVVVPPPPPQTVAPVEEEQRQPAPRPAVVPEPSQAPAVPAPSPARDVPRPSADPIASSSWSARVPRSPERPAHRTEHPPSSHRPRSPNRRRSPSPPRAARRPSNAPPYQGHESQGQRGSGWGDRQADHQAERERHGRFERERAADEQREREATRGRETSRHEALIARLLAGLPRPAPASGTLSAELARSDATLKQLRTAHVAVVWDAWRADQEVKNGEVELAAWDARRAAAEEGLRRS